MLCEAQAAVYMLPESINATLTGSSQHRVDLQLTLLPTKKSQAPPNNPRSTPLRLQKKTNPAPSQCQTALQGTQQPSRSDIRWIHSTMKCK